MPGDGERFADPLPPAEPFGVAAAVDQAEVGSFVGVRGGAGGIPDVGQPEVRGDVGSGWDTEETPRREGRAHNRKMHWWVVGLLPFQGITVGFAYRSRKGLELSLSDMAMPSVDAELAPARADRSSDGVEVALTPANILSDNTEKPIGIWDLM